MNPRQYKYFLEHTIEICLKYGGIVDRDNRYCTIIRFGGYQIVFTKFRTNRDHIEIFFYDACFELLSIFRRKFIYKRRRGRLFKNYLLRRVQPSHRIESNHTY